MRPTLLHALLAALFMGALAEAQGPASRLSASDRAAVDSGASVVVVQQRAGSPWPAVTVYRYVDATPEQVAAVFTDYDRHHAFIPNVKHSRATRAVDPATADVDYVLELPLLRDESYTVRDRLRVDSLGTYRVDWTLVRATSTIATVGHVRFAPHWNERRRRTGTLLEYHNFVTPGSRLAGLGFIRNRAIDQVQITAEAVARETEMQLHRGGLDARVARLRQTLRSR